MKPTPAAVKTYIRLQMTAGAVLALGIGAFVVLSYRPAAHALTELRSRMSESGRELADNELKTGELPVVLLANADLRRQLKSARPIPSEADIGGFTVLVADFCKAVGIGQFSLLPQGARRGELCTELPITLEFTADFRQCMAMLARLDGVPRLMQVRTMKMSGRGDGTPLTVKLEISLFHVAGETGNVATEHAAFKPRAAPRRPTADVGGGAAGGGQ